MKQLIYLLPVSQRLRNQGNTSKKPFRGLVQAWIWNRGLSKQEIAKQNNCPFNCACVVGTDERTGRGMPKGVLAWQQIDTYIFRADAKVNWTVQTGLRPQLLLSPAKITDSCQCWNNLIKIWSILRQKEWQAPLVLPLTQTANRKCYLWIPH